MTNRFRPIAVLALLAVSAGAQAEPLGQVFEATVVGVDNSPSLQNATQEAPLSIKLRFDNDQCWAVADVVPLVGKTNNNISGRLRGVDCTDGRFRNHRGFAAGYLDPTGAVPPAPTPTPAATEAPPPGAPAQQAKPLVAKTGSIWIGIFF